jgi:hypothetical protein
MLTQVVRADGSDGDEADASFLGYVVEFEAYA